MFTLKTKILLFSYNNKHIKKAETGNFSHETIMTIITGPENIQPTTVCC